MNGYIYGTFDKILVKVGLDGIVIVSCAIPFVSCVLNVILSMCLDGYTIKKRMWHIAVAVFSVLCCCGFCDTAGCRYSLPFFVGAFNAILFVPLIAIKPKKSSMDKSAKELVEFIDKNIYGEDSIRHENKTNVSDLSCEQVKDDLVLNYGQLEEQERREIKENSARTAKDFELDFSHVKSVISRLSYYDLKDTDKRQVKELENALLCAERGKFDINVKSRINDGLGALLKIMSKYGI